MEHENTGLRPVVELTHVDKMYQRGQETVTALHDLSVTLMPGTVTVVLGPSGGGKSTLLHILGGMDRPSHGTVRVQGQDIAGWSSDELARYRRTQVGFVFQAFHLIGSLNAQDNVALPLLLAGVSAADRKRRAQALLERVGLADRAQHRPGALSGGQIQRVAIARALAADPPLILADEPTGNLDSASGSALVDLLVALAHEDGRCVVIVTHNAAIADRADQVLHIQDGRITVEARTVPGSVPAPATSVLSRTASAVTLGRMAGRSLRQRWVRSLFTGLGIAIGVAAMVTLIGLGTGLKSHVMQSVLSLGSLDAVTVSPQAGPATTNLFQPSVVSGPTHPITAHTLTMLSHLPGSRGAYASAAFMAQSTYRGRTTALMLNSLPPASFWSVPGLLPTLQDGHLATHSGTVVLPADVARVLAGAHQSPRSLIGHVVTIRIAAMSGSLFSASGLSGASRPLALQALRVTGIGAAGVGDVPYVMALHWMAQGQRGSAAGDYPGATVLARQSSQVAALARQIQARGYGTSTLQRTAQRISQSFRLIETGLGVIGGIALVVAGLMIGVVMSMAVLERRRDIGIFRALGARRRDIFRLFLSEAVLIGLAGGLVGLGLGGGVGWGINMLLGQSASGGLFALPWWLAGLSLVLGGGVSLVAGAVPAGHAAALSPVDALRQE